MVSMSVHLPTRAGDVERFFRGEGAREVVKSNRARLVVRADLGRPGLYVKQFPRSLWRDRALKEARLLGAMAEAGVACPRLVATARDGTSSYIITEEIPGAAILKDRLAEGKSIRDLLGRLAAIVRRLHEAGFEHRDLHVGNVLVGDDLYVLDVHRAEQRRRLSRSRRLEGVAFTAFSFVELTRFTEVLRFFRAYGLGDRRDVRDVLDRMGRLRARYYRSRDERCVKESTAFAVRADGYYRRDADPERVAAALRSRAGTVVKQTGKERLLRLEDGWFRKETTRARALAIWRHAHALEVRGIGTPRLHACGRTWIVGEWVAAPNLWDYLPTYATLSRAGREAFLRRLARAVRKLHARGVFHRDLKATNVLVAERDILFVDLDRVRFGAAVPDRDRIFNLAQLNASVTPPITRTDRLRFLRAYFGCGKPKPWIRDIMRLTVARRHRWPR